MVLHDAFYIFNFNKNTTTTVTFQSIFARYAMDHCENERKKPDSYMLRHDPIQSRPPA